MELFASQDPRSYSLYFDLNIWFRARKVTGTFEKRAPGPVAGCGLRVSLKVTGILGSSYKTFIQSDLQGGTSANDTVALSIH